ncbi:hypothetical protein FRB90_005113 [Tulasnella sp. 427]|nr:hypothetical protein FRB90_005113 [Tulasnella sp. 427]
MLLQKLGDFFYSIRPAGSSGQDPEPCYILRLPPDILEEIIRVHLALTPGNFYSNSIKTLSLVHLSWLPTTRYLAYVKVSFIPKSMAHANRMLKHLEKVLPPPPPVQSDDFVPVMQKVHAYCKTLFVGLLKTESLECGGIGLDLFRLVGHSVRTLELKGVAGSFWNPRRLLDGTPFFPRLRQLKVLDIGIWTLMAYLRVIWSGDGEWGPSGLVIHHDFEMSRERDLLCVPVHVIEENSSKTREMPLTWSTQFGDKSLVVWEWKAPSSIAGAPEDGVPPLTKYNTRPPLDLYISRRSHVGHFMQFLPQANILLNALKRSGVETVDIWLKEREELGQELVYIINAWGWDRFIDRDMADGETTHLLLHEF